jgi:hypothetical protein
MEKTVGLLPSTTKLLKMIQIINFFAEKGHKIDHMLVSSIGNVLFYGVCFRYRYAVSFVSGRNLFFIISLIRTKIMQEINEKNIIINR